MNFNTKKLLPHLIAIVTFYVLTAIYFAPLFQGKAIRQSDVSQFKGMSQEIVKHREQYGEEPLWTNSMFSGMPAYQISVKQNNNWLIYIDKFFKGLVLPMPSVYFFTCMLTAYFLMLVLGLEGWLAIMGALAYALSTYFLIIIEAGHNTKAGAISYMPAVLAGFIMSYRGNKPLLGAALVALFLGLEFAQNHIQITYYLLISIALYVLFELIYSIKENKIINFFKTSALLLVASMLAIAPNMSNILLTEEYSKASTRGKSDLTLDKENKTSGLDRDYVTQWSFDKSEVLTLLIPNYFGGASGVLGNDKEAMKAVDPEFRQYIANVNQYWGNQPFTSGPTYAGAIICFLFVLAVLLLNGPLKWALLVATLLSIMLSWGKNFMPLTNLFLDYFPGYNKFRSVTMILVIAELSMPILALLGLKKIIENPSLIKEKIKLFYIAFFITGGFALLVWLMPDLFVSFWADNEYETLSNQLKNAGWPAMQQQNFLNNIETARKTLLTTDALRSFLLITLSASLIYAYILNKINKNIVIITLTILTIGDLWLVNRRYLNQENYVPKARMETPFIPNAANNQILQDPDPNFRVFNLTVNPFSDASTSYFHKSIGGYHGAKLKRYQELIEYHLSKNNLQVLNMLNTKYFIVGKEGEEPRAQRNPQACGNAWFIKELKFVENADSELLSLANFNPLVTAFSDKKFKPDVQSFNNQFSDSTAKITLTQYKANHLIYQSQSNQNGFAVFSEIYYQPGWNAYIDGKPAKHIRVNYVLRGMEIPAGNHKIEFKFEPSTYKTGQIISLAGSILLVLFVIGLIYLSLKREISVPAPTS